MPVGCLSAKFGATSWQLAGGTQHSPLTERANFVDGACGCIWLLRPRSGSLGCLAFLPLDIGHGLQIQRR